MLQRVSRHAQTLLVVVALAAPAAAMVTSPSCWRCTTRGGERLAVRWSRTSWAPSSWWSPSCWRCTTRGGERLGVRCSPAVDARLEVVAELAALHEVARQAGADARTSAASPTSPRSTTRGGERLEVAVVAELLPAPMPGSTSTTRGGERLGVQCSPRQADAELVLVADGARHAAVSGSGCGGRRAAAGADARLMVSGDLGRTGARGRAGDAPDRGRCKALRRVLRRIEELLDE